MHDIIMQIPYIVYGAYCIEHIPHIVNGERRHVNGRKVPCEREKGVM